MFEIIQLYIKSDPSNRVINDNYIYILHANGQTAAIDPSITAPVLEALEKKGWKLDYILNTHHHSDHIGGNDELKQKTGAKIIAYKGDAHRIKNIDIAVNDNQKIEICGLKAEIIFVPGHTLGQIAYYFKNEKLLFCGDTLFAMGCGRMFEGTPEQMFTSLKRLATLPDETKIYCGHEYTENNGNFALTLDPDNEDLQKRMDEVIKLRKNGEPTVPFFLGIDKKTNPFLRAKSADEFAKIRQLKDAF